MEMPLLLKSSTSVCFLSPYPNSTSILLPFWLLSMECWMLGIFTMDISQSCTFDSYPKYRMSLGPDSRDSRRLDWLGPRDLSSTHLGPDTRGRDPGEPSAQRHGGKEYTTNSPFHATTYIIQTTGLCSLSCNPRVTQPHETK